MKPLWTLALAVALGDAHAPREAYEAGRFAEAQAHYERLLAGADDDELPALALDAALAAVRADDLQGAQRLLEQAQVGAGSSPELAARLDQVRGGLAYVRCRRAAELIGRAEAEPFLLEQAIVQAEQALAAFARVVEADIDAPAAARNAERAARALAVLEQLRDEQPEPERQAEEPPPPEPETEDSGPEHDAAAAAEPELSAAELEQLLVALERERDEQRAVRRARRIQRSADVERDW